MNYYLLDINTNTICCAYADARLDILLAGRICNDHTPRWRSGFHSFFRRLQLAFHSMKTANGSGGNLKQYAFVFVCVCLLSALYTRLLSHMRNCFCLVIWYNIYVYITYFVYLFVKSTTGELFVCLPESHKQDDGWSNIWPSVKALNGFAIYLNKMFKRMWLKVLLNIRTIIMCFCIAE